MSQTDADVNTHTDSLLNTPASLQPLPANQASHAQDRRQGEKP